MGRVTGGVTVRRASPEDIADLEELATLDGRHLPPEPMLLAEVDDDILAALSLADGTAIADPFYPTAGLIDTLRDHAAEIRN